MLPRGRRFRLRAYVGTGSVVALGATVGLLGTGASPTPRSIDQTAAAASGTSSSRTSTTARTPVSGHSTVPRGGLTGLDDRQALRATRRAFKAFIDAKGWADLQDQPRLKVKRYVGDRAAVINTSGKRVLVSSLLPLRSGAGKAKRPIDTRLESDRGRLRPAQPLSDFSLALRAASGSLIDFPRSDVKVTLDGTRNARGIRSGKSLIYPNAFPDADAILKSLPASVGFAVSLRGPRAPQNYPVSLTLRPGDQLLGTGPRARGARRGPAGGAVVLRAGRAVSTISAPVAVDAAGTPLPVRTLINGDRLVYRLAHHNRKTVYPALLDPFVSEDQRYWFGAPPGPTPPSPNPIPDFNGWAYSVTGVGGLAGAQGTGGFGNGLNIFASAALTYPPNGTIGTWTFQAPFNPAFEADGARIVKADFGYTAHARSQGATSSMLQSIYNRQAGRTENGFIRGSDPNGTYTAYPNTIFGFSQAASEGIAGNKATYPYRVHCLSVCNTAVPAGNLGLGSPGNQVRLGMLQNGGRPSVAGGVFMGSSLIMMTEQAAPRITTTGAPSAATWTNAPFTINATVNDYGLGPDQASITAPNNTAPLPTATQGGACTAGAGPTVGGTPGSANKGDRNHRCTAPLSLQAPSSSLADGSYNITVNATDILGNPGSATVPVKLDRVAPGLAITGALKDAEDSFAKNGDAAQIVATDANSGVRSLDVKIDGVSQGAASTCATDGCSLTRNVVLDTSVFKEGEHTVLVTAIDGASNARTTSWKFSVDTTDPVVSVSGPLAAGDDAILIEDRYTMDAYGDDQPGRNGLRSGIRSLTIRVDPDTAPPDDDHRFVLTNPECAKNTCDTPLELSEQFEYVASTYGAGDHDILITVEDGVGNTATDTISFNTPHAAPLPAQTLDTASPLTVDGAAAGDRFAASLANVGDVNGDGFDDILAGAPGADVGGQSDAGTAYLIYGSKQDDPVSLTNSSRVVRLSFNQGGANAGAAVAAGGDINGDGRMDLLVGAPGSPALLGLAPVQGRVWAIFGSADLPTDINLASLGSRGFEIRGPLLSGSLIPTLLSPTATSTFGGQIATRRMGDAEVEGDVNGDGMDDIVLGSGNATSPALTGGVAYVVFGRTQTGTIDLGPTNGDLGTNGFRIYGAKSTLGGLLDPGQAGTGTTIIGDVNGDERAEIAITDPGQHATGRTNAGSAYVIYGRTATTTVGLANLGDAGYTITGRTGDAVATAASPGDIDADGRPDLLLGGHGAFVHFAKTDITTQDLDGAFAGYRLDPPSGVGFARATVAGVGDQDGDQAPDTVVGFPQADSNRGIAYLAYGKIDTDRVDLGTLRGDQGTRLDGAAASRSATATEGTDVTGQDGQPASVVGAPDTAGSRGQFRTVPSARLAQQRRTDKYRCAILAVVPQFPFVNAERPSPFCRRALRNNIDIPLSGDRGKAFNPRPRCGLYNPRSKCFPSAYRNGNARKKLPVLAQSGARYPLYDSFGPSGTSPRNSPRATSPIGFVEQAYPGCFNIYDGTNTFRNSTDADVTKRGTPCDPGRPTSVLTRIEYQGRGCMATRNLEDDFIIMRVLGDGVQGFISLDAVPVAPNTDRGSRGVPDGTPDVAGGLLARDFADLQDSYQGCGRKRPRQQPLDAANLAPTDVQLHKTDNFIILPDPSNTAFPFLDQYVSPEVFDGTPSDPDEPFPPGFDGCVTETDAALRTQICTGFSGAYQGSCWAPDVAAITSSTTYVSGAGPKLRNSPSNVRGGGLVRGFIRRDAGPGSFAPYDRMGYLDNNVPVALGPHAHWVFGNAHPGASAINATQKADADPDDREQNMFGWSAIRQPNVAPARYTC